MLRLRSGVCGALALIMCAAVGALPPAALGAASGRAYEMVSPPGKNGGDVMPNSARTRVAVQGDAALFTSLTGFGDVIGTGVGTEFLSRRTAEAGTQGWATHAVTPPQQAMTFVANGAAQEPGYMGALSADLSRGVFRAWSPLTPAPMVVDAINLYMRTDLRTRGSGSYSLITDCPLCVAPLAPLVARQVLNKPFFAGASADYRRVVFESNLPLARGAPAAGNKRLFLWDGGVPQLAGVLPTGVAATRSIAGRGVSVGDSWRTTRQPLSSDGTRVVFTVPANNNAFVGPIHQRINGRTTVQINASERTPPGTAANATFWAANADGNRVFFTSTEALTNDTPVNTSAKLFMWERQATNEVQTVTVAATAGTFTLRFQGQTTAPIAFDAPATAVETALAALSTVGSGNVSVRGGPGNAGGTVPYTVEFMGDFAGVNTASLIADGTALTGTATLATTTPVANLRFISVDNEPGDPLREVRGVIGASEDGRYVYFASGGQLVAGKPLIDASVGIYLWHDGVVTYIGMSDAFGFDIAELLDGAPINLRQLHTHVTPDGKHLLFNASSGLGLLSVRGGRDYVHGTCAGDGLAGCRQLYVYGADADTLRCVSCNPSGAPGTASAAVRQLVATGGSIATNYLSRPMSDDGRYVFFNTRESLVAQDVNGKIDAYEYDTQAGRAALLSSGTHPTDSYFLDAGGSGGDAFFVTREQLVGWDVDGGYDLYDARIGGGFPDPVAPPPGCSGDTCQGSPSGSPAPGGNATSTFRGPGNVRPGKAAKPRPKQCRRGKVKKRVRGRVRCVARRSSRQARRRTRAAIQRRAK